jgi:hypothetical protein
MKLDTEEEDVYFEREDSLSELYIIIIIIITYKNIGIQGIVLGI